MVSASRKYLAVSGGGSRAVGALLCQALADGGSGRLRASGLIWPRTRSEGSAPVSAPEVTEPWSPSDVVVAVNCGIAALATPGVHGLTELAAPCQLLSLIPPAKWPDQTLGG